MTNHTVWQNGLQAIRQELTPSEASHLHHLLNVNDVIHAIVRENAEDAEAVVTYPVGASGLVRECITRARHTTNTMTQLRAVTAEIVAAA